MDKSGKEQIQYANEREHRPLVLSAEQNATKVKADSGTKQTISKCSGRVTSQLKQMWKRTSPAFSVYSITMQLPAAHRQLPSVGDSCPMEFTTIVFDGASRDER